MGFTLVTSTLNALTSVGQLDIWKNGFGIPAPIADSAAMILGPTTLLTGPPLASLTYADLQLDSKTVTSVNGLYVVEQSGDTGLSTMSLVVNLPITPNTNPLGVALYHAYSQHLWYISAFSAWPYPLNGDFTWNVQIPLGQCIQD